MSRSFNILSFEHAAYIVSSLEKARAFWVDCMGGKVVIENTAKSPRLGKITGAVGAEADYLQIEIGGKRIELLEYRHIPEGGGSPLRPFDIGAMHTCFNVDDLNAALEAVAKHGYKPQGEPQRTESHVAMVYVVGPDGATIELAQPL